MLLQLEGRQSCRVLEKLPRGQYSVLELSSNVVLIRNRSELQKTCAGSHWTTGKKRVRCEASSLPALVILMEVNNEIG